MLIWSSKDPDEVLDYTHDWTDRLGGDTITGTPTATVIQGDVVKDSTSTTSGVQTVWLSAGTDGTHCLIELECTTTGGRTFQEVVQIWIRERGR